MTDRYRLQVCMDVVESLSEGVYPEAMDDEHRDALEEMYTAEGVTPTRVIESIAMSEIASIFDAMAKRERKKRSEIDRRIIARAAHLLNKEDPR